MVIVDLIVSSRGSSDSKSVYQDAAVSVASEKPSAKIKATPDERSNDAVTIDINSDICRAAQQWLVHANDQDLADRETFHRMNRQWTACVTGDPSMLDEDNWYVREPEYVEQEVTVEVGGTDECQSILDEANELSEEGYTDHLEDYTKEYEACANR